MSSASPKSAMGDVEEVDVTTLRALVEQVLITLGATAEIARLQADQLIEGDLRGHPSHGVQRLPMLVRRIRNGVADPTTTGQHTWRSRSVLTVDGGRGLGPAVAMVALGPIIARAREEGIAIASISNANHLGMLAPYVERAADAGVIGVAMTTSEPLVHAWGGKESAVGTNPIAFGIPTADHPVVVDLATGQISRGRVIDHANRNVPLPPDSVVDADGNPTTDPHAALAGSISPFGGPKGYALAVAIEMLVGALTRSALGQAVVGTLDADQVCNKGDLLFCLDPGTVLGDDRSGPLSGFVEELRASPPRDATRPVTVPGDRSRKARTERLAHGRITVSGSVWADITRIATELGLSAP